MNESRHESPAARGTEQMNLITCVESVKAAMKSLLTFVSLALLASLYAAPAAENLLQDGGFAQHLD
jgi:hypothetical protein